MEILSAIVPLVSGPASAVLVLLGILYGLYKIFTDHLLPIITNKLNDDKDLLQQIMREHGEDRVIFKDAVEDLTKSLGKIDKRLGKIEEDLQDRPCNESKKCPY